MSVFVPSLDASLFLESIKTVQNFVPDSLDSKSPLGVVTESIVHFPTLLQPQSFPNVIRSFFILRMLDTLPKEVKILIESLSQEPVPHLFDH